MKLAHLRSRDAARWGFALLCAAAGLSAAHAGFLDERITPPAPAGQAGAPVAPGASASAPAGSPAAAMLPQAGVPFGTVVGDFTDLGWKEAAPRVASPVSIPSAISRLLPPKHGPVTVEGDDTSIDDPVSWPDTGMSRKEALEYVARNHGLNFVLGDGLMRVSRAKVTVGPAMYALSPADQNFRRLLKRWAVQAGYTFGDEHWTLSRDVPIVASASLGTDFKGAVRQALDSTELTAMPGRPCFYSNSVLRVVPRGEQCDRLNASANASARN